MRQMRPPCKIADLLHRRLRMWHLVIVQDFTLPESEDLNFEDLWNRELHLSDGYIVRQGFAIGEFLTTRGRLLDMLEAIEQCWPNRTSWCEKRRQKKRFDGILFWFMRASVKLQDTLVLDDLAELNVFTDRITEHDEVSQLEVHDLAKLNMLTDERVTEQNEIPELEVLYAYRDAKARLRALRDLLGEVHVRDEEIDDIAFKAMEAIASNRLQKVAWCTRAFIFSERLFPWLREGTSGSRRERYPLIYQLANLSESDLEESVRYNLQIAMMALELEEPELEDIQQIVFRVAVFIKAFGYDNFVQDVTQDGGQWGPTSGIGSREIINLIPGKQTGACHRIVMGLARGRNSRSKGSLPNVLRKVRDHMCHCVGQTNIAIVITDIWDKDILMESADDIASCKRQGKKFLFLLVNGGRLIPMDLSFGPSILFA